MRVAGLDHMAKVKRLIVLDAERALGSARAIHARTGSAMPVVMTAARQLTEARAQCVAMAQLVLKMKGNN